MSTTVDGVSNVSRTSASKDNIIQRFVNKKMNQLLFSPSDKKETNKAESMEDFRKRVGFFKDFKPTRKEVLEEKEARVNKFFNKVKNWFGYGEKMTKEEKAELDQIRRNEHYNNNFLNSKEDELK